MPSSSKPLYVELGDGRIVRVPASDDPVQTAADAIAAAEGVTIAMPPRSNVPRVDYDDQPVVFEFMMKVEEPGGQWVDYDFRVPARVMPDDDDDEGGGDMA